MTISQGQFNQELPFNSYKYMKKHFDYDAIIYSKSNAELREQVILLDVQTITNRELIDLFKEMNNQLTILNGNLIKHITLLKARKKAINISFM